MALASLDISDDNPPAFIPGDWIGKNKIYDSTTLPLYVLQARTDAFAIPEDVQATLLPLPTLPVIDFIDQLLPTKDPPTLLGIKPKEWFSMHGPTHSALEIIRHRPLPHVDVLRSLEEQAGQLWLDGMQSVRDPRYTGGEYFPLWALTFWKEATFVLDAQLEWEASGAWLTSVIRSCSDSNVITELKAARTRLSNLHWNGKISAGLVPATELTQLLGPRWVSGDLVDLMIQNLPTRFGSVTSTGAMVFVAGTSTLVEIQRGSRNKCFGGKKLPLLYRFERGVRAKQYVRMVFPAFINSNHWIVFHVDTKNSILEYAESLRDTGIAPNPNALVKGVQRWLKSSFGRAFTFKGPTMAQNTQPDTHACALFAVGAIAHAVFGQPLLKGSQDIMYERVRWFLTLAPSRDAIHVHVRNTLLVNQV
ncbi:hypothetical protein LXA43DRAFT_902832 [Ganoderma leucocontextum]|nr:hypothetical protein LXA43DRAFT_902832 [Ganoderma leucocontextum]